MITFHSKADGTYIVRGESTDVKPINAVPGNSIFEELDTGKEYFYREADKQWIQRGNGSASAANKMPKIAYQPDSAATTVASLRADFNALLAELKTAGIMEVES